MGFRKDATPVVEKTPETQAAQEGVVSEGKAAAPKAAVSKREYTPDEARVRGQVRMHGIIAGYKVASALAPTLANTSASIKDELHKLAVEVAAKIEAYSFLED